MDANGRNGRLATQHKWRTWLGVILILAAVGADRLVQAVQRGGAALRLHRGILQVRIDRHRAGAGAFPTGSGSCCRGCSRSICRGPAATTRSVYTTSPARTSRWASRSRRSGFRGWGSTAPSVTRPPSGSPRRVADSVSRRGNLHVRCTRLSALPLQERCGSALQRRHAPGRDRQEHPAFAPRPPALPLSADTGDQESTAQAEGAVRVDRHPSRLGSRANRSVQPGEGAVSGRERGRHHRQFRHDADLEHGRAAEPGVPLGRTEPQSAGGRAQLGHRRRGHREVDPPRAAAEAAGLAREAASAQVSVGAISDRCGARSGRARHLRA